MNLGPTWLDQAKAEQIGRRDCGGQFRDFVTDPQGPASNAIGVKIIRGGAWDESENNCRSAKRTSLGDWTLPRPVEVSGGAFVVNGVTHGSFHVHNSCRLRGGGRILSKVSVDRGGVISAGSVLPGLQAGELHVTELDLKSGGMVSLGIFGPSSTGGNDSLVVQTAHLTNATLSTGFSYPPREGDVILSSDLLLRPIVRSPLCMERMAAERTKNKNSKKDQA